MPHSFCVFRCAVFVMLAFSSVTNFSVADEAQWRDYFARRTTTLRDTCLTQKPADQTWPEYQKQLRRELYDMLGLWPIPEKTDLKPVVTGQIERDGIIVEKLHFQSRPGLYVTGNLYRPSENSGPLPAVVYVCGHGEVKRNGIAYGNKTHYRHHGAWFAKNGYVCLTIDTLQLGEIEGIHHGTHRLDMWWWLNRGYTPAGVEAWNSIRAVDYLVSRPEVDPTRLAVTGRSGGGAYSWWLAALDERIKCAIPVAGITDLQDHVIDDCVQGHCDCMYFVNQYGWDYPAVAALVAPRPLLISNTDRDPIFPLEGVQRVHARVRNVYRDLGKAPMLGLNITAGEHVDTQELQVHALRWLNAHLKNDKNPIPNAATKLFEVEELKVFKELPADQRNTTVHEWFVEESKPQLPPVDGQARKAWKEAHYEALRHTAFRCWPHEPREAAIKLQSLKSLAIGERTFDLQTGTIQTDDSFELPIVVLTPSDDKAVKETRVIVPDAQTYESLSTYFHAQTSATANAEQLKQVTRLPLMQRVLAELPSHCALVFIVPRGIGPTTWPGDKKSVTQFHRRLYLLGETLDALQVYDIATMVTTIAKAPGIGGTELKLYAEGVMATNVLYAAAATDMSLRLELPTLSPDFRAGPFYLNIQRKQSAD